MSYYLGSLFVTGGGGDRSVEVLLPSVERTQVIRIKRLECWLSDPRRTIDCAAGLFPQRITFRLQQGDNTTALDENDPNCLVASDFAVNTAIYDDTRQDLAHWFEVFKEVKIRGYFRVTRQIYFVAVSAPADSTIYFKIEYDKKDTSLITQAQLLVMGGG